MIVAFDAASVLFPSGNVRLTTIVAFAAFVTLALARHSWLPIAACLTWLFGFEIALDVGSIALGRPATLDAIHLCAYLVICAACSVSLERRGLRPVGWLLAGSAVIWIVWLSTGFHVNNHSMVNFSSIAEVWNETAKVLWALAYLLPLSSMSARQRRTDGIAGESLRLPDPSTPEAARASARSSD